MTSTDSSPKDAAYDRGNIWVGPQDLEPAKLEAFKRLLANVDRSSFPRPLPVLGPLLGLGHARVTRAILLQYAAAARVLGRNLTHDEATAFAFYTSKEINLLSYSGPVGFAGGYWRAYNTRAEGKYPFFKAKPDFDPNTFKMPLTGYTLRGALANTMHMAVRYSAYGIYGAILSFIVFAPYVASVGVAGIRLDPRLRDYNEAISRTLRDRAEQARNSMSRNAPGQPAERRWPSPPEQESREGRRRGNWPSESGELGDETASFDDASPTGGQSMDDQFLDDTDQPFQESVSPPSPGPDTSKRRFKTAPPPGKRQTDDFYDYADDDADRLDSQAAGTETTSPTPTGSAWERIRRGAASSNPSESSNRQETQRRQQERRAEKDYSFSRAQEDDQLAKEGAQRQFNERVERERKGGDFGVTRGGKGRWE